MREGESRKEIPAALGRHQRDLAPIARAPRTTNEAALGRASDELDCAMVLDLQTFRDEADGRRSHRVQSLDGEKELVLLRLDSRGTRRRLAEVQKSTDDVSELRQRGVVGLREAAAHGAHYDRRYIVSRYIVQGDGPEVVLSTPPPNSVG